MPRPPSPAQVDALQTDYLMWSAYVDGELKPMGSPLTLAAAERSEVASIAERFAALIRRTMELCLDRPELLAWFGFPLPLRRMIEAERRRAARDLEVFARYDVFRTPQGWKLSEFNTDVPGGIHEATGLNDLIVGDPRECPVVERATALACRDGVRPSVGLIYASGFGEDLEQCQFLRRAWNRRGVPAILGGAVNLTYDGRRLSLFGEPVEVLYRFFPAEWLDGVPTLEALLAAVRDGAVRMINPFAQLVAQSKKGMAFWWERGDLLTSEERELVERHVPRTELFRPERLDDYLRRRESLVAKRGFGRVGEQVLIGSFCTAEEWAEELRWPLSEPGEWIVQERFDVVPESVDGELLYPCYGAYVVDRSFAGFYARAAKEPFIGPEAYTAAVRTA